MASAKRGKELRLPRARACGGFGVDGSVACGFCFIIGSQFVRQVRSHGPENLFRHLLAMFEGLRIHPAPNGILPATWRANARQPKALPMTPAISDFCSI